MAVGPSSRLGPYEVKSLLGRGGMGEVHRGWDSRLHREVAIKVLPEAFSADPARLRRFEQEARAAAALNHPNIVAVFDVGTEAGTPYVVSELLEGQTLREAIDTRQLPLRKALDYAIQIAEGLAAAHDKGIVHRDIKPENVFVTSNGGVKILDFGLAKLREASQGESTDTTTLTSHSKTGVVIGTVGYMSPEQVRGEPVDCRTDIFSFGATLYEMISGVRAFKGDSAIETLHAILNSDPAQLSAVETTKPEIARIVQHCLEKDAAQRFQSARDLTFALKQLSGSSSSTAVAQPPIPASALSSARRDLRLWAIGAVALTVLAGLAGWAIGRQPAPSEPGAVHLSIPFAESPRRQPYGFRRLAISDDGQRVAYVSLNRLWLRRMDENDPVAIGPAGVNPFFSPDGAWVGLVTDAGVIKVPVEGGPPTMIAPTTGRSAGAAWGPDGTLVFATSGGLYQVASSGGEARLLLGPDREKRERLYAWPEFLPGGGSILFTILPEGAAAAPSVAALDLRSRQQVPVLTDARSARYVPTGHLVYMSTSGLRVVAFDPGTKQVRGESVPLQRMDVAVSSDNGAADFAVSATGTLVSLSADAAGLVGGDLTSGLKTLSWIDGQGNKEPIGIEPGSYSYPRVSPDGSRVALDMTGGNRDIWILNLERLSLTQLTNGPTEDITPEWSPDGRRVFFASDRAGDFDVYSQSADGATSAVLEFAAPGFQSPQSFTPGGDGLIVYDLFKDQSLLNLGQPRHLEPLLHNDTADERVGRLSPDGKWIVYESDESGKQFEIFLRPFPDVSARREKVSVDGGRYPRWEPKGTAIYYVSLDGDMMAVPVTRALDLKLGAAKKLFAWQKPPDGRSAVPYDISPLDGRFLVTQPEGERAGPTDVSVILNWFSELTRLVANARK